ncbi:SCP2 sterol-binding domain-containing protein [Yoonia sp.]|uniref:SCP2 sterol-binding domain-containing protein n=1 Tax=Yoonia sp. TaxID=2212373 RepID=UPI0039769720
MTDVVTEAVAALNAKMAGAGFDGTAKFTIEDEGSIIIDSDGARAGDEDAEVTLTATTDVFKAILDGEMNPTTAFMTGKLTVDGDMGQAMKLSGVLS